MNKNIIKLMNHSGIVDNPDREGIELFAELLLKECMSLCAQNNDWRTAQEIGDKYGIN